MKKKKDEDSHADEEFAAFEEILETEADDRTVEFGRGCGCLICVMTALGSIWTALAALRWLLP